MVEIRGDSFVRNLIASVRVWRRHPLLPLLSLLIWAFPVPDEPAFAWLVLPILLFTVGWVGTERIWYLRAFRGHEISPGEVWKFTWAFFGRYLRVGFLVFIPFIPILVTGYRDPSLFLLLCTLFAVPVDIALTFVTPTLAYSTNRVKVALRLGLRMVRSEWPRSAWYVLFPPLAMLSIARVFSASELGTPATLVLTVASTLLYLAFKGGHRRLLSSPAPCGRKRSGFHRASESGRNRDD